MYFVSSYPMMASTFTTFMLSMIFLILSYQSGKRYMLLWGSSWLICSVMFLLDFLNLALPFSEVAYVMFRQLLALLGAHLFLSGTHRFFQIKLSRRFFYGTMVSVLFILAYPLSHEIYTLAIVPNIIYCSGLLIVSGCLFLSISWTQRMPEKFIASFLILTWSIFINHFGFTFRNSMLAFPAYFIGLFIVNLLMLILILIYFKKLRFIDSKNSARFRLLVENSSDSMFLYDYRKKEFEYISPNIAELIGVSDKILYDMPERFFDHISLEKKNAEIIYIFSRPVSKAGNGVICLYKNDTIERWSNIHYLPIRDNTGTVSAVEGILRDITERKKMEADLEAASDARKELLENISHEIKTPITLIQGYTQSLVDKILPAESTDSYLRVINSKAQMLATLMDDLAQVSNLTSQTMEYKFYEQPAKELMDDLLNQCEFQISSAGRIAVISSRITFGAFLIADPARIQQVVSNLINNAIRHTPENSEIHVTCATFLNEDSLHMSKEEEELGLPDGVLMVTVSDRGDGIDEKELPRIFERNFSGSNRTNPKAPRTGLGLYISKQIITQHSGTIAARNNEYGGAEIFFTLPYYK